MAARIRSGIAAHDALERLVVGVDHPLAVLLALVVVREQERELLEDLVLVVRQRLASCRATHPVVEQVVVVEPLRELVVAFALQPAVRLDRLRHRLEVGLRPALPASSASSVSIGRRASTSVLSATSRLPPAIRSTVTGTLLLTTTTPPWAPRRVLTTPPSWSTRSASPIVGLLTLSACASSPTPGQPLAGGERARPDREGDLVDDLLVRTRVDDRMEAPAMGRAGRPFVRRVYHASRSPSVAEIVDLEPRERLHRFNSEILA